MSNVVRLFKEEEPEIQSGPLSNVMDAYITWATKQGVDTTTPKFLHGCATIMILMQIGARN